jgi:predicted nucleic acid-binding protein
VSHDLLAEWERVIVRERHRSPDAAAAITATIRQFFADTRIPAESYRGLVAEVDGPDPDDNAHLAAAVAGQVELLVTWNGKDFECGFSRKHAIKIVDPDHYLRAAASAALAPGVRPKGPARRGAAVSFARTTTTLTRNSWTLRGLPAVVQLCSFQQRRLGSDSSKHRRHPCRSLHRSADSSCPAARYRHRYSVWCL